MSIKFVKFSGRYMPGDVAMFTKASEDEYVKQGFAVKINEDVQPSMDIAELNARRDLAADAQPTDARKAAAGKR